MEDKEYDQVEKNFKKFKRSRIGKMVLGELDRILFKFYLEGYIINSQKEQKENKQ